jgi:hypothetical protein
MLFAKQLLTEKEYNLALSKGVSVFLYNEINFTPTPKEGVQMVNCTNERVPSTWFTWRENERVLNKFKKKYPQFFKWGHYDMTLAFQKALYWSNQKTGYLQYVKNKDFYKENVLEEEELFQSSRISTLVKYAKVLLNRRVSSYKSISKNTTNVKVGFFLKNEFQVTLYKHLILEAKGKEDFLFFVLDKKVQSATKQMGVEDKQIVICNISSRKNLPIVNSFLMNQGNRYVLNLIIRNWEEVEKWIGVAEQMISYGISKALINEGENGLMGAVLCEVFKKNGVISFNTMNGMKSGQAQDSYVNFDYWFVWDEQMKKLLQEKNKLSEKMLLVSGHLMEDEAKYYQYNDSLSIDKSIFIEKRVISLFSVRGKREEKIETFKFLFEYAEKHEDVILLVRPHYSEKEEDIIRPISNCDRILFIENNPAISKTTLYDQLTLSGLSICFGSTVSLESKWFGVPCITVEKRKQSLIYAVDGIMILHVQEIKELKDHLEKLTMLKDRNTSRIDVSKYICNVLEV